MDPAQCPCVCSEENCRRAAVLFKTLGIPLDTLALWDQEAEKPELDGYYMTSEYSLVRLRTGWLNYLGMMVSPQVTLNKIRSYYSKEPVLNEPFYIWINQGEETFIHPPSEIQAHLEVVFENPGVKIILIYFILKKKWYDKHRSINNLEFTN